ncbi:uncharacterized protein HGUI_03921 [Hanseniaspora guilliermondii]|uniref:Uncharacterized protein n=1 Tax=Hanseniaspora guilliermondii TaxID=56406 RepID=A0A1L0B587_9ASCO|nr:uncharacterized protein HGUI_03921 [Hanseniaspora guilliermondii]
MSAGDKSFEDDFLDEDRPLDTNHNKIEFAKFTEPISKEQDLKVTDTFHTYYYTRNVTIREIYSFVKSVLLNHQSENKSLLTYMKERMKFLFNCQEYGDLENAEESDEQGDVGGYFPIWTCLSISMLHLIMRTFELKHNMLINKTFILLMVSMFLQITTVGYAHKLNIFQNIMQFKVGILNLNYIVLKLTFEFFSIGLGTFLSSLLLIFFYGVFITLVNFKVWSTMQTHEWKDKRISMLSILFFELFVYTAIAILDNAL